MTPHRSRWGTCILQTWTPGFNSSKPSGLRVSTWVTLKNVPEEMQGVAIEIASGLGVVLGVDKRNNAAMDKFYCIGLLSRGRWKTHSAVDNTFTGEEVVLTIDYENLPIRCRLCLSTEHLVRDCPCRIGKSNEDGEEGKTAGGKGPDGTPPTSKAAGIERSTSAARAIGGAQMGATEGQKLPGPPPLGLACQPNQWRLQGDKSNLGVGCAVPPINPQDMEEKSPSHAGPNTQSKSEKASNSKLEGSGSSKCVPLSRETPLYEWNGFEKVYRGPKFQGRQFVRLEELRDTASTSKEGLVRPIVFQANLGYVSEISSSPGITRVSPRNKTAASGGRVISQGTNSKGSSRKRILESIRPGAQKAHQPLHPTVGLSEVPPGAADATGGHSDSQAIQAEQAVALSGSGSDKLTFTPEQRKGEGSLTMAVPELQNLPVMQPALIETGLAAKAGAATHGRELVVTHVASMPSQGDGDRDLQMVQALENAEDRLNFDLNGTTPCHIVSVQGDSSANPRGVRVDGRGQEMVPASMVSIPRTPSWLYGPMESLPDHLHSEFMEWYRNKSEQLANGGFLTPQPRKLTGLQLQRWEDFSITGRRNRASVLQSRRNTPGQSDDGGLGPIRSTPGKDAIRGPLLFHPPSNSLP